MTPEEKAEMKEKFLADLAKEGITDLDYLADKVLNEIDQQGGQELGIKVLSDPKVVSRPRFIPIF